jgi:HlyD family secretion protein
MTANLTFQIEEKKDVIQIPWSAVRFFPKPELVRQEDRKLLEGGDDEMEQDSEDRRAESVDDATADERVEASRKRLRRHVWVLEGEKLRAVEVLLGISDYRYAELSEGEIEPGQKLVVDVQIGGRPG